MKTAYIQHQLADQYGTPEYYAQVKAAQGVLQKANLPATDENARRYVDLKSQGESDEKALQTIKDATAPAQAHAPAPAPLRAEAERRVREGGFIPSEARVQQRGHQQKSWPLPPRRPLAGDHGVCSVPGAQGLPVRRRCSTQCHCCGVKGGGVPRGTGFGAGASGAATTGSQGAGGSHQAATSPTTVSPTRSHAAIRTDGRGVTHQQTQALRYQRCWWRLVG